jgi:hypothetical protein
MPTVTDKPDEAGAWFEEQRDQQRARESADRIASRAAQIREACQNVGVIEPEIIAAAIIADRLEDVVAELDHVARSMPDDRR